jgi:membrane associated rhomboid family serine protease
MPLDSDYQPWPEPRQPVFNAPPGTVWLCIALVAAHILFSILPAEWQYRLLQRFAFVPAAFLAQFGPRGELVFGEWLSLVSYAFLHGDLLHLFVNAGMLLAFGALVEREIGTPRVLLLFVLCSALGAVAQALAGGPDGTFVIGASGAGYGLIGAGVHYLYGGRVGRGRREALLFVAGIMGLNLLFGLAGLGAFFTGAEIAWQAHIGGFVAGLALGPLLHPRQA